MRPPRIYLDNAATSWPKPAQVADEMARYVRDIGAPAGRSGYREAALVERTLADTRRRAAQLIDAASSELIFTFNGTDSLNLAIHGLIRSGDHVVTSVAEHNSVLRPLRFLEEAGKISVTRIECRDQGRVRPSDVVEALRPETRLVALTHASNVTGAIQPLAEIGTLVAPHDAFFLVDAAQTVGHVPVSVNDLSADLLACPGHKGLMGPLGVGLLYISQDAAAEMVCTRQGGTGTLSQDDRQPTGMPDKYESGNHNVPGIFGLAASLDWIEDRGIDEIHQQIAMLASSLWQQLATLDGVTLYGPTSGPRVGVLSINLLGFEPHEVANMLDTAYSIQVRAGIQCAPLMHKALGTLENGGTVRLSLGAFTTDQDVQTASAAIAEIASSL